MTAPNFSHALLANSVPPRPRLSVATGPGWMLYPLIHFWFSRLRNADGNYPPWVMRVPNTLTLSRAFFPVYGGLFTVAAINGQFLAATGALAVIIAAYATDALDGEIARYTRSTSQWGQTWDPIFDKVAGASMLVCGFFLVQAFLPELLLGFTVLAVLRFSLDVALAGIARAEIRQGSSPKSEKWGKLKSGTDVVSVVLLCLGGLFYCAGASGNNLMEAGVGILAVAVSISPLSIKAHWANLTRS